MYSAMPTRLNDRDRLYIHWYRLLSSIDSSGDMHEYDLDIKIVNTGTDKNLLQHSKFWASPVSIPKYKAR